MCRNKYTDQKCFKTDIGIKVNLNVRLKNKIPLEVKVVKITKLIQTVAQNNTEKIRRKTIGNIYLVKIRILVQEKKSKEKTKNLVDKNLLNRQTQQLKREITKLKKIIKQILDTLTRAKNKKNN